MSHIDIGDRDKPVIVFIHGLGSHKHSWQNQLELSEHFRLIIPDLRGHGSNAASEDITIGRMALDVIVLLNQLHIKEAFIVGHSLGGIVAKEIYKQRPDTVKGLILSNTTSYISYHIGMSIVSKVEKKLNTMSDDEYIRDVVKKNIYDKDNIQRVNVLSNYFFKINRSSILQAAKAPIGVNYFPTLLLVQKPTLIIGALNDKVTPPVNALMTKMFLPSSRLKLFSECGHLPNVEKTKEFNETVLNFVLENI